MERWGYFFFAWMVMEALFNELSRDLGYMHQPSYYLEELPSRENSEAVRHG